MTALQCPGCGHIHSSGEHGNGRTFRCLGCRRLLSVPVAVAAAESSYGDDSDTSMPLFTGRAAVPERMRPAGNGRPPVTTWTDDTGDLTDPSIGLELPPEPRPDQAPPGSTRRSRRTPVWMRVLVWAAALGVGLAVTAMLLRAVGILDVDAVINAYAERGFRRYTTLLILVPLWAAASATLAHVSLEWVARRRRAG